VPIGCLARPTPARAAALARSRHADLVFSEGPFHGLSVRETFVVDANGIVRIDRQVIDEDIDCTALTARGTGQPDYPLTTQTAVISR
jgi:hypothetical protein